MRISSGPGRRRSCDGTGAAARFNAPNGVTVDGAGNVHVADTNNNIIRKITAAGVVTTLAGTAGSSGGGMGGTGAAARFNRVRNPHCAISIAPGRRRSCHCRSAPAWWSATAHCACSAEASDARVWWKECHRRGSGVVVQLNPAGSAFSFARYLGGAADDQGIGVATDSSGHVYLSGVTESPTFPTGGAPNHGGKDAYVVKLNP